MDAVIELLTGLRWSGDCRQADSRREGD